MEHFVADFVGVTFHVGVSLHACGEVSKGALMCSASAASFLMLTVVGAGRQATDMAMEKCLEERAAIVMCPCCVGKIKLSQLQYPRYGMGEQEHPQEGATTGESY